MTCILLELCLNLSFAWDQLCRVIIFEIEAPDLKPTSETMTFLPP